MLNALTLNCMRLLAPRIHCVICGTEVESGAHGICVRCDVPRAYQRLPLPFPGIAAFHYAEPIRPLIHRLKYDGHRYISGYLAYAMAQSLSVLQPPANAVLIPVALHKTRQKERGYNQSEDLSRELAHLCNLHHDRSLLTRTVHTPSQTNFTRAQRQANLQDAFTARKTDCALLVDDVCTTGSTLLACADALKKAGCRQILAVTASFAPPPSTPESTEP